MIALLYFILAVVVSPLKSKSRLEAENAALRYQLIVLRRKVTGRIRLSNADRLVFIQLYRWFPSVLRVITVIRPETLVRWHQAGFRHYWRLKPRRLGGRPQIGMELRALIRRMSIENPLWGAPRNPARMPQPHCRLGRVRRIIFRVSPVGPACRTLAGEIGPNRAMSFSSMRRDCTSSGSLLAYRSPQHPHP
jgi:hypothetical protein